MFLNKIKHTTLSTKAEANQNLVKHERKGFMSEGTMKRDRGKLKIHFRDVCEKGQHKSQ